MQNLDSDVTVTEKSNTSQDKLLGAAAPALVVGATDNFDVDFARLQGFQVLLCFYPQNGLPGITQMAKDLSHHYDSFKEVQTCVFGVSNESLATAQEFKDSLSLPFQLIADVDNTLASALEAMTERTLFGDKIQAIQQCTFLLDTHGKIARIWREPEVRGHCLEVLEAAHRLSQGLTDFDTSNEDLVIGEGQEKLAADLAEIFEV